MIASLPRTLYPDRLLAADYTKHCLLAAAASVGVDIRWGRCRGRSVSFRLALIRKVTLGPRGGKHWEVTNYQRTSRDWDHQRTVNAVCWHGHRDFMRVLFKLLPDLLLVTGLAHYHGKNGFEETFESTGYRNIGSQFAPMQYREACTCNGY